MSSAPLHVDVLIVNYGTGDLTAQAVAAVAGPGVHVWVWDNSGEVVAAPPPGLSGLFGDGTNTYFAAANNELFNQCDGDLVLLLNPDVVLPWQALMTLTDALQSRTGAWGVAPRLLNPDGSDQNYLHGSPTFAALLADRLPALRKVFKRAYRAYTCADVDLRKEQVVVQPPAACLLVRRAAVGTLFDPRYRLFFNDADLARRCNKSGTCHYIPSVQAVHLRGESFRRLGPNYRIAREYDRSMMDYARANIRGGAALLPVVWLRGFAMTVLEGRAKRRPARTGTTRR